jgi:hypothetical protein
MWPFFGTPEAPQNAQPYILFLALVYVGVLFPRARQNEIQQSILFVEEVGK